MTIEQRLDKIDGNIEKLLNGVHEIGLQNIACIKDHETAKEKLSIYEKKIDGLEAARNQQLGKRALVLLFLSAISGSIGAMINHFLSK